MLNKKGFEMTWNTLVAMILAILLVAVLIGFFTMGSVGFSNFIKSFSSYSNVDAVVSSCNLLVDSNSQYSFCCEKKQVKYYIDGKKATGEFSCLDLLNKSFTSGIKSFECLENMCN
ncbi:Uncharacterised protein [uncultured archaeon]|nr:Uncharacterised protein [uncultured archaeon]